MTNNVVDYKPSMMAIATTLAILFGILSYSTWDFGMLAPIADNDITSFDATKVHDQYRDMLVARSIMEDGRPRIFGQNFILHPPMFFALIGAAHTITGNWVAAGHLTVIIASIFALLAFSLLVRELAGERAGLISILLLGTHRSYYLFSLAILHPMILCFLYSSVIYCYLRACAGSMPHLAIGTVLSAVGMFTKLNFGPCYLVLLVFLLLDAPRTGNGRRRLALLGIIIAGGAVSLLIWNAYLYFNGLDTTIEVARYLIQFQDKWRDPSEASINPFLTAHDFTGFTVLIASLAALLVIPGRRSAKLLLGSWAIVPLVVFLVSPIYFEWKFVATVLMPLIALTVIAVMDLSRHLGSGQKSGLAVLAILMITQLASLPIDMGRGDDVWHKNLAVVRELERLENPSGVVLSSTLCREIALFSDIETECLPQDPDMALRMILEFGAEWVLSHRPLPFLENGGLVERVPLMSCTECSLYRIDLAGVAQSTMPGHVALQVILLSSDDESPLPGARIMVRWQGASPRYYRTDEHGIATVLLDTGDGSDGMLSEVKFIPFGNEPTTGIFHARAGQAALCSMSAGGGLECNGVDIMKVRLDPRSHYVHGYPFSRA